MNVAVTSLATSSIQTGPFVVRPPAFGLVPVSTAGLSAVPSDFPPEVYES